MKQLLALLLFVPSLCFAQSVTLPYNPDANADSAIGAPDLLEMLPLFGGYFTPDPILIDGMEINEYLNMIEENGSSTLMEGSEHGQMLYWNGEEWVLVSVGENGQFLGLIDNTPVWQDLPTGAGVPEVGCADQTACNYDSGASVNWAPLCVYEDECGVCDGPGAIYECGCADLPEGDCDCDGNQLDALNVCGGTCAADVDGDGICDDGDDCIGEADECGVCNGPGAIYECGCSEPDPEACDCAGNTFDAVGVCGGDCTEDADGDGICDTEDDCVGEYDFCGVCNGPGPILGCGCEDIPDGYCDCNGNVLDAVGTCGGACQNDFNSDGICDDDSIPGCTYEVACNYDPSASINDGSCDFTSCYGCTDPAACNYSPAATFDNGVCWYAEASYDCDSTASSTPTATASATTWKSSGAPSKTPATSSREQPSWTTPASISMSAVNAVAPAPSDARTPRPATSIQKPPVTTAPAQRTEKSAVLTTRPATSTRTPSAQMATASISMSAANVAALEPWAAPIPSPTTTTIQQGAMMVPVSCTAVPWTWPATMSPLPTSTTTLANSAPAQDAMTRPTLGTTQRVQTIAYAERLRCLRTVVRRGASARVKGNATSNTLHRAPSSASMEYSATPLQPLGFTELRPGGHRGGQ